MDALTIGFTGNRYGLKTEQKYEINLILNNYLDLYDNIIFSHGDSIGSDTEFHKICLHYKYTRLNKNITIRIFPSNNHILRAFNNADILMEEKPNLVRNQNIIKNSSILIACPIDKNKEEIKSETWSIIRQAKRNNLTIHIL